ncbi:MAG: cbb3-type cytochrome c oxidase subunit I [Candidatus Kariarchaeaceae archaeon]|jgi:cytochrome c oxidase subunit 1
MSEVKDMNEEKKDYLEEAKNLSIGYLLTGLAIIFVATLLGFLNRLAQTGVIQYKAKAWYTLMTLHGMAAFVGWGVFVCMGLTWYVLVKILDSPLHSPTWIKIAYWFFMAGVALIVISTLFGEFASSWVFLYPLPFEAGPIDPWADWTVTVWILGVLLAGVSILITQFEVLLTVRKAGVSIIAALGFEALKPAGKKGYKVPIPLVPFVVNALGMIIATIPFAVFLVVLMLESLGTGTGLDALAAKNVLWWFGHPVVYALLFPAAGFGYYMTERITNSRLIGERITKLSWMVATIVQNVIGSHHVYADLVQPLPISISMQLLTYGVTIPSLASLFVIFGQFYVKDFEWNLSAKYLFLAAIGWLLAGLSGVVNATILLNNFVHNTLWIVAHFHTMALLNITMMIFGAAYFLVKDFTGKEVYDLKWATRAMWMKYIGTMGLVHMWFVQGILGGVRRSAVSTPGQGLLTWLSIPFGLLILIGLWTSMWVITKTVGVDFDKVETPQPVTA